MHTMQSCACLPPLAAQRCLLQAVPMSHGQLEILALAAARARLLGCHDGLILLRLLGCQGCQLAQQRALGLAGGPLRFVRCAPARSAAQ